MSNSAEEWISLREFARRRGVDLRAVQKAIESGRVTAVRRDERGRLVGIEVAAATMQWDMNTDPVEAAKSGKILGQVNGVGAQPMSGMSAIAPAVLNEPAAATETPATSEAAAQQGGAESAIAQTSGPAPADKDPHGYYEARARREQFQSKQAELDYLQALGELVSSSEMRRISGRRYRTMRDKLLNIADRLAAVLAAERDPAQVHAVLTADIKRVLHELSDDASAELAAGLAERVAA
jgi:hypothetical protein